MPYKNYIMLDEEDLDEPIYRIMSVSSLLQCLVKKQMALVHPSMWDDPFENWLLSSSARCSSTGELSSLESIHNKVTGQCWTRHSETDAMWRIYSPDSNGVKVKTTPRKLLEALKQNDPKFGDINSFIGKVQYECEKSLELALLKIDVLNTNGSGIAETLLYKRKEFSHEEEIRLIHINSSARIHLFNIDPNSLLEEAMFDPRIDKNIKSAFEAAIKKEGFRGRITTSKLYSLPKKLTFNY